VIKQELIILSKVRLMEKDIFLGIGTNLGDREANLDAAIKMISLFAFEITAVSSVYETEPWGFRSRNKFLNQAVRITSNLEPADLISEILNAELSLGRKRKGKQYSSRIIDIDILFYGERIINNPDLIIPHPLIGERMFVLAPLCEIAPDFIHPVFSKSISSLLGECSDINTIKILGKE